MVNNKAPCTISKRCAAFIDWRGAYEAFKSFALGQASISSNGSKVLIGSLAKREMPLELAAFVRTGGHEESRTTGPQ